MPRRVAVFEGLVVLGANGVKHSLLVRADKVLLEQVLLNLVMNGMDALTNTSPDAREIMILTELTGASQVEVSVTDTGTGIPDDKLEGVFDAFYTTKRQGTGLGLSIARTIVEVYGGKIWAENRAEGGAVFHFSLPLVDSVQI